MRRADRLFDIIQIMRAASRPVTAAALAAELEVAPRTIYRDIATLQARRLPIEGAAGIGYVLRPGFDLPPLMFTTEEAEAIAIGARLLHRTGDPDLQAAAERVLSKVTVILPEALRAYLEEPPFWVSGHGAQVSDGADLACVRGAIRDGRKLRIAYGDEQGTTTDRTIWPVAIAYYVQATLVYAWCELRSDYRHFRADRITSLAMLAERYPIKDREHMAGWLASRQAGPAASQSPTARSNGRDTTASSS
ncbi:MAG: YafY family protein [Acetobacteraceae bacterium]